MHANETLPTLYYTPNLNPRVAVAVARYVEAPVRLVRCDPMGAEKERFRPLNPNTLAPILVEAHRNLWETDAIAMRLSALSGSDFWPMESQEEVLMWVSWSAHHFTNAGSVFYSEHLIAPRYFGRGPDARLLEAAGHDFARYARILDDTLADRTWLVGGRPTYADFRVATALPFAEQAHLPVAPFRNIARWNDRLNAIDAWRAPFDGLE